MQALMIASIPQKVSIINCFNMKLSFTFFLLFFSICQQSFAQNDNAIAEMNDFGPNPGNLTMFLYANNSGKGKKLPLVVVLHGCGENAGTIAKLTGWNKLADSNHFIVLYPQQKMSNNYDACFNWFKLRDIERGNGECESVHQMINYVRQHYNIDSEQIFITGFSAGAALTVAMMASYPETFKSGAVYAGAAYQLATTTGQGFNTLLGNRVLSKETLVKRVADQNPGYKGKYPTMIIYQGLNDWLVNPKNAGLLIEQWTGICQAASMPEKVEEAFMGIKDIKRSEFTDSAKRTVVVYYEVKHLGHQLMVVPGERNNECGHTGVFGVNKGFNSIYQTAKEFGLIIN